jgi:uncharacterized protein (UPF0333 family)
MEKLPTLMLFSAVVLFVGAVAAYVADQTILALVLLVTAIGDAAVALWLRERGRF